MIPVPFANYAYETEISANVPVEWLALLPKVFGEFEVVLHVQDVFDCSPFFFLIRDYHAWTSRVSS